MAAEERLAVDFTEEVEEPLPVALNHGERLPVADTVDVKLRRDAVLAGDVVGVGT